MSLLGGGSETGIQKKYFTAWKVHKKEEISEASPATSTAEDEVDTKGHDEEHDVRERESRKLHYCLY